MHKNTRRQQQSDFNSDDINPCLKEGNLSLKCLSENNYDKKLCKTYFDNYAMCNEFWNDVQAKRRKQKITPILPPPEEREKIKAEHFKNRAH